MLVYVISRVFPPGVGCPAERNPKPLSPVAESVPAVIGPSVTA
jgi:hypothetical protein